MVIKRDRPTKQVTQYIIDCQTVDDFFSSEPTDIRSGAFVFVFWDEMDYCYRGIRPLGGDDFLPYFEQQNKAPIGYGFVVGTKRVALTLFDGQELIDNGTK